MRDVVINGGGPVGMGLAIELGQRGHTVTVVERHPEPQPIPKGQNLTQRTVEHFAAWGCKDDLLTAHPIPEGAGVGGMTSYGTLLSDHHYDWPARAQVGAFYAAPPARLPQYATERVLRKRVAELPNVEVLYGWEGTALEENDNTVRLSIKHRTSGETKDIQAQYLVGTDGARSMVREASGLPQTLNDHGRLMALLVFRSEELHALLERYPGKAFYCVLHPDFDGYWQFFGRVDHGVSWFFHAPVPHGTTRDTLDAQALLHTAVGTEFAFDLDHVGLWDLRVAVAEQYGTDRVFISGDAAHSHPPYGGYGINIGFEDARNLGWKLAATLEGWGGGGLLASYSAERQPVFATAAKHLIEKFIEDDRAFLETHAPGDPGFQAAWNARSEAGDWVWDYEPNYEGSPLIGGPGTPSAIGSHQIEARGGHHLTPVTGFDWSALGTGFSLLTSGNDGGFSAAAEALGISLKLLEVPAETTEALGANLVLVRPDGFVAWAGTDDDARAILTRATAAT